MNTSIDALPRFTHLGIHYRVRGQLIERYDGPKIGWTLTGSLPVHAEARRLGLLPEASCPKT